MNIAELNNKYPHLDLDKLLGFIEGSLSEEESKEIEKQIETDSLTAHAITELENFYHFNKNAKEKAHKYKMTYDNTLDKIDADQEREGISYKKLGLAAAFLTGIIVVIYLMANSSGSGSTELYADYYEPYPVVNNMRAEELNEDSFEEGLTHYEQRSYNDAVSRLIEIKPEDSRYSQAQFYLGQSYLAQDEIDKAIEIFSDQAQNNNSVLQSHSQWYLALAYIKIGNTGEAEDILEEIAGNENSYNHTQARELLEELR